MLTFPKIKASSPIARTANDFVSANDLINNFERADPGLSEFTVTPDPLSLAANSFAAMIVHNLELL